MANPGEHVRLADGRHVRLCKSLANGETLAAVMLVVDAVAPLRWSTELPKCDGRYLMRAHPGGVERFVVVAGFDGGAPMACVEDIGVTRELSAYANRQWVGPLDDDGRILR